MYQSIPVIIVITLVRPVVRPGEVAVVLLALSVVMMAVMHIPHGIDIPKPLLAGVFLLHHIL